MIRLVKVSGLSLYPDYQDGDFVFISKIPILFGRLHPDDVVVIRQPPYGILVKKVGKIDTGRKRVFVVGNREDSVDSRRFGMVKMSDVVGKVIWHIRKPARKLMDR